MLTAEQFKLLKPVEQEQELREQLVRLEQTMTEFAQQLEHSESILAPQFFQLAALLTRVHSHPSAEILPTMHAAMAIQIGSLSNCARLLILANEGKKTKKDDKPRIAARKESLETRAEKGFKELFQFVKKRPGSSDSYLTAKDWVKNPAYDKKVAQVLEKTPSFERQKQYLLERTTSFERSKPQQEPMTPPREEKLEIVEISTTPEAQVVVYETESEADVPLERNASSASQHTQSSSSSKKTARFVTDRPLIEVAESEVDESDVQENLAEAYADILGGKNVSFAHMPIKTVQLEANKRMPQVYVQEDDAASCVASMVDSNHDLSLLTINPDSRDLVIALYPFNSRSAKEMSLNPGDIIQVRKRQGTWIYGTKINKRQQMANGIVTPEVQGWAPVAFVTKYSLK